MKRKKEEIYNKLLDMVYIENKEWTPKQARKYKNLSAKKNKEQASKGFMIF